MLAPPRRRFTIADAMLLTVAAALGSLLLRRGWPGLTAYIDAMSGLVSDSWGAIRLWVWINGLGSFFAIPLMAALIVARVRSPRPRCIRDGPGLVASVAVLAALVPGLIWVATIQHRLGFRANNGFYLGWMMATFYTWTAVPGAWLALVLARRWRPRPDWVDRSARLLGWYWVGLFASWKLGEMYRAIDRVIALGGWR